MTDISKFVPGGILPTDHVHVKTHDDTCSRCRREIGDGEVPLMLWMDDGERMLQFCQACLEAAPIVQQRPYR